MKSTDVLKTFNIALVRQLQNGPKLPSVKLCVLARVVAKTRSTAVLMTFCFAIVWIRLIGLKMLRVAMFVVSFKSFFFFFCLKKIFFFCFFFFLVGSCCGSKETNGCVDNTLFKDCSTTSKWTKDELCDDVCSKF